MYREEEEKQIELDNQLSVFIITCQLVTFKLSVLQQCKACVNPIA